jgi:predicted esterase
MTLEKQVSYTATNTYVTLNSLSSKTLNVWLVFHGMGYLSRYFLKYFSHINPTENYIIAPQGPSKYYQGKDFKHVGASWLTRETTSMDIENILNYTDAVFEAEKPGIMPNFIVFGYSQGVSVATRWLASRKISCDHLVIHSGGIPKELTHEDFKHLEKDTKVTLLYGDNDPYISNVRKIAENELATKLFGNKLETSVFKGVHEVNREFILRLSE